MATQTLTEIKIKNAKAKDKLYRLFDGAGLCLKITPSNKKVWEYRYKSPDTLKEDTLVLGDYPTLSLAEARRFHKTKRADVLKGINPKRNDEHLAFPFVFKQWWNIWSIGKNTKYVKQVYNAIDRNCMKTLGHLQIDQIKTKHIVKALQPFEDREALEYLHRTKSGLNQLFDFAISRGLCEHNPSRVIVRSAFKAHESSHHRSPSQKQIYRLFDFFEEERYSIITRLCTELTLRTCTRIQETSKIQWSEVDFEKRIWTIPANRMKMKHEQVIPLTPQMLNIFEKMYAISKDLKYVFPGRDLDKHINTETPRTAIQGYGIDSTVHGFRHLASILLNESGLFRSDVIEACLSHKDKNKIRATYNKAKYLTERKALLTWWNTMLDQCSNRDRNIETINNVLAQQIA